MGYRLFNWYKYFSFSFYSFIIYGHGQMKNKQCKKEFEPRDEIEIFCSQECKEEALAELDSGSDECLSCQ